ncbi:MAG TPA: hypothetical protein VFA64_01915 [Hyphomicrobiaceae bacterium]|nr:hypothetical protein [Hyphomicrobiaceae bacterium]
MSTEMDSRRRTRNDRAFLAALAFAGGLLAAAAGASAQPRDAPLPGSEQPDAASPAGARYIPGVGFRFVPPPNYVYGYRTRVYGYYADRESMRYYRGYRAHRAGCDPDRARWHGDRCGRSWRW